MNTHFSRTDGFRLDCGQAVKAMPPAVLPVLLAGAALMMSSLVLVAMLSIDIARAGLT